MDKTKQTERELHTLMEYVEAQFDKGCLLAPIEIVKEIRRREELARVERERRNARKSVRAHELAVLRGAS